MVSKARSKKRENARVSGEAARGTPRTRVSFRALLSHEFLRPDYPKWRACSQVMITVSNMVAMILYFSTLFCNSLCIDCETPKPVNTRNTWERYGDTRKKPFSCEKALVGRSRVLIFAQYDCYNTTVPTAPTVPT